jgi:hypothetical protein
MGNSGITLRVAYTILSVVDVCPIKANEVAQCKHEHKVKSLAERGMTRLHRYSIVPVLEASFCALRSLRTLRFAVRVLIHFNQLSSHPFGPTKKLAEREGFEPSKTLPPYTRSRRASSTTPAPLHTIHGPNITIIAENYYKNTLQKAQSQV